MVTGTSAGSSSSASHSVSRGADDRPSGECSSASHRMSPSPVLSTTAMPTCRPSLCRSSTTIRDTVSSGSSRCRQPRVSTRLRGRRSTRRTARRSLTTIAVRNSAATRAASARITRIPCQTPADPTMNPTAGSTKRASTAAR